MELELIAEEYGTKIFIEKTNVVAFKDKSTRDRKLSLIIKYRVGAGHRYIIFSQVDIGRKVGKFFWSLRSN